MHKIKLYILWNINSFDTLYLLLKSTDFFFVSGYVFFFYYFYWKQINVINEAQALV